MARLPRLLFVLGIALTASAVLAARPRPVSQCTSTTSAQKLRDSLESYQSCNDDRLALGAGATCELDSRPRCARDLVEDAMALAYGEALLPEEAAPLPALSGQVVCQQAIGRAATDYTATWLAERVTGATSAQADATAAPELDVIGTDCQVSVAESAGRTLPQVGIQCAAATPAPGGAVDTTALRDCMRTLLARWVEAIGPDPPQVRPNIVFIMTDDQRFDMIDDTTVEPGVDAMAGVLAEIADQGVTFTTAFSATPLCSPNRSTILTGQYAHRHLVRSSPPYGGAEVFDDDPTLATRLQQAGYRTALIGKYMNSYSSLWTPGSTPYIPPGWDRWFAAKNGSYFGYTMVDQDQEVTYGSAPEDYQTDVFRDQALAFIDEAVASGEPFFLYLPLIAPHGTGAGYFNAAPRHAGMFAGLAPYRPPSFQEPDMTDKPVWDAPPTRLDFYYDNARQGHLETLQAADEAVVAIMDRLRFHGIIDETFVAFTSDNGYLLGEHRLVAKNKPFEEAIRVPVMVRYPPLAPLPRTDTRLLNSIDWAPTILELAGAAALPDMDGESIVDLVQGTESSWRTDVLTEAWPEGREFATVQDGRWKYTEYTRGRCPPEVKFTELFDLEADPFELDNLDLDPAHDARKAQMAARIREIRPSWPDDAVLICE